MIGNPAILTNKKVHLHNKQGFLFSLVKNQQISSFRARAFFIETLYAQQIKPKLYNRTVGRSENPGKGALVTFYPRPFKGEGFASIPIQKYGGGDCPSCPPPPVPPVPTALCTVGAFCLLCLLVVMNEQHQFLRVRTDVRKPKTIGKRLTHFPNTMLY